MAIQVQYMSQIKATLGIAGETAPIDGPCTLGELFTALIARHGDPLRRIICDAEGRPLRSLLVCVDDRQSPVQAHEPIPADSHVTLASPIGGG